LLEAYPEVSLLCFDRDAIAVAATRARLAEFGARARVEQSSFERIGERLDALGVPRVAGLVADLGVSSEQLGDPERGMSFRAPGPIDMRMDRSSGETALELIERLSQDDLADVIYELGEERASRRIARCIKQALASGELETTLDLRRAVVRAVGPRRVGGVDPGTRTFQALRMKVNGEIEQLRELLGLARDRLAPGGVAAIISFHSLEDRLVKREFLERELWERRTPKPLVAADEELQHNPRSRSAKLRIAARLPREDEAE
jgi:16S rRNA (cytosine1402-N4)-methyltransferase